MADHMAIEVRGLAPLFQVFDMPTSLAFYRDVLGFELVSNAPIKQNGSYDWVMLSLHGVEVMLNTAYEDDYRPAAPDPARIAAHEDATLYFGCPDVDAAYAHIRAKGVDVKPPRVAHYGMKQLYLRDPDGFSLCFQWPASSAQ
jgi:glyoxylase I family protein